MKQEMRASESTIRGTDDSNPSLEQRVDMANKAGVRPLYQRTS